MDNGSMIRDIVMVLFTCAGRVERRYPGEKERSKICHYVSNYYTEDSNNITAFYHFCEGSYFTQERSRTFFSISPIENQIPKASAL